MKVMGNERDVANQYAQAFLATLKSPPLSLPSFLKALNQLFFHCLEMPECEPILQQTIEQARQWGVLTLMQTFIQHHTSKLLGEYEYEFENVKRSLPLFTQLLPTKRPLAPWVNNAQKSLRTANNSIFLMQRVGILTNTEVNSSLSQKMARLSTHMGANLQAHGQVEQGLTFLQDATALLAMESATKTPAKFLGELSAKLLDYAINKTTDSVRHQQVARILRTILQSCAKPHSFDWLSTVVASINDILLEICTKDRKSTLANLLCQFLENSFRYITELGLIEPQHVFITKKISTGLWEVRPLANYERNNATFHAYLEAAPTLTSNELRAELLQKITLPNLVTFLTSKATKDERKSGLEKINRMPDEKIMCGLFEVLLGRNLKADDYTCDELMTLPEKPVQLQPVYQFNVVVPQPIAPAVVEVVSEPIDPQAHELFLQATCDLRRIAKMQAEISETILTNGLDPRKNPLATVLTELTPFAPHFVQDLRESCQPSDFAAEPQLDKDTLLQALRYQTADLRKVLEVPVKLAALAAKPCNRHQQLCAQFYLAELTYLQSDKYLSSDRYPEDWQAVIRKVAVDCKSIFGAVARDIKNPDLQRTADFYLKSMEAQERKRLEFEAQIAKAADMNPAQRLDLLCQIQSAELSKEDKTRLLAQTTQFKVLEPCQAAPLVEASGNMQQLVAKAKLVADAVQKMGLYAVNASQKAAATEVDAEKPGASPTLSATE
jgi:hypothetical protein